MKKTCAACGAILQEPLHESEPIRCVACRSLLTACTTCSNPIRRYDHEKPMLAQRCNGCWEVESRLEWYLESEGGRAKIRAALAEAER